MLYALEIPASGGNTYFNNMYRAYESLPDELKRRIEGLTLKHDGTYNSGGYLRRGIAAIDNPVTSPGVYHPLVCTHPETRRRVLYLGRRRNVFTLLDYHFQILNRCSMSCGRMRHARNSCGTTNGVWATLSCGTTGARCIGGIPLTRTRAGTCIALKIKDKRAEFVIRVPVGLQRMHSIVRAERLSQGRLNA